MSGPTSLTGSGKRPRKRPMPIHSRSFGYLRNRSNRSPAGPPRIVLAVDPMQGISSSSAVRVYRALGPLRTEIGIDRGKHSISCPFMWVCGKDTNRERIRDEIRASNGSASLSENARSKLDHPDLQDILTAGSRESKGRAQDLEPGVTALPSASNHSFKHG